VEQRDKEEGWGSQRRGEGQESEGALERSARQSRAGGRTAGDPKRGALPTLGGNTGAGR
jgi:hypothetical protein